MKCFRLSLLVLLIILTSCSLSKNYKSTIYNSFEKSMRSSIFEVSGKVIFSYDLSGNWYIYNPQDESVKNLSVDTTEILDHQGIYEQNVYPGYNSSFGVKLASVSKGGVISEIDMDTSIPQLRANNNHKSLINQEVFEGMLRAPIKEKLNVFCDIFKCPALEEIKRQNYYIYNDTLYRTYNTVMTRSDLFGRNETILPIHINTFNQAISFWDEDIYYIDVVFDLRLYNQNTHEDRLIIKGVEDFFLDDNEIYFSSLDDQYYYQMNFQTGKVRKLISSDYNEFIVMNDNIIYLEDFSLYKSVIGTNDRTLITDKCIRFIILDNYLIVISQNGDVSKIDI